MKHRLINYRLTKGGRDRSFLISGLSMSLFLSDGRIKTTITKARAMRPFTEKLITIGKKGDLSSRRRIISLLKGNVRAADIADKLINEIGIKYKDRPGGYLRIVKAGHRLGDNSQIAYVELV